MKILSLKNARIAATVLFLLLLLFIGGEVAARATIENNIENNPDIYVNGLIKIYQQRYPTYPVITRKDLISLDTSSDWRAKYIHLVFEVDTAKIHISARLLVDGVSESWILYESKL